MSNDFYAVQRSKRSKNCIETSPAQTIQN